jgi:DNA mismatch repair protein PMS2
VQDNGGGISPADYETIALKHYTSKLSSYDDLTSLQTFGFRGEALSSLCALSIVAAKQGTTVVVETLFHNLPVRRKELEKNIKREYNKVLQLLNAYACISVGVKFTVSNVVSKG